MGTGVLASLGYHMGSAAGSAITKIHPATYIMLALALRWGGGEKSLAYLPRWKSDNGIALQLLLLIALIAIYLYAVDSFSSISFMLDTLVTPVLILLIFRGYSPAAKRLMRAVALYGILVNSLLAILERLLAVNFFPIATTYGDVFRSTSLLGHPLNNALITLVFVLYVLVVNIAIQRKMLLLCVLNLALICFGARGALFTSVLATLLLFILPLLVSTKSYYQAMNKTIVLMGVAGLGIALAYLTLNTPIGERLVQASFYDDSSEVRTLALSMLDFDNLDHYLGATAAADIERLSYANGVEIIENFFIIWILRFGIVLAGLLLLLYSYTLYRYSTIRYAYERFAVVALLLLGASTNNSLATNTQVLSFFILLFCTANGPLEKDIKNKLKIVKSLNKPG